MSSEGAKQDESASAYFGKIKGSAEKALYEMRKPELEVASARPLGIGAALEHVARSHWLWSRALRTSLNVLEAVSPYTVSESSDLAKVCIDLAVGKGWDQRDEEGVIWQAKLRKM